MHSCPSILSFYSKLSTISCAQLIFFYLLLHVHSCPSIPRAQLPLYFTCTAAPLYFTCTVAPRMCTVAPLMCTAAPLMCTAAPLLCTAAPLLSLEPMGCLSAEIDGSSSTLSPSSSNSIGGQLQASHSITAKGKLLLLCGAHGVGKTTLAGDLEKALAHVEFEGLREVARSIMVEQGITQSMLMEDVAIFWRLQHDVVHRQAALERSLASCPGSSGKLLVSDRCVADPLAYVMWKFGCNSAEIGFSHRLGHSLIVIQGT